MTGAVEPGERARSDRAANGAEWTILGLLQWSGRYLEEKGVDVGRRDAEHLLAESLGASRLDLYLQFDRPLSADELGAYKPLLLRRAKREPLQYVLGHTAFRELELQVDERVLIPRPETEVLVESVLSWTTERGGSDLTAVDVGTGSGAIALSLAHEGPFGRVVATDPSSGALELAARNRSASGLDDVVELRAGSFFDCLDEAERFDVVVSNPPYIADGASSSLAPEVRDWEPSDALFAGPRGLDVLLPLIERAPAHLKTGGLLALELSPEQVGEVKEAVRRTAEFGEPRIAEDWVGRDRILLAVRR